MNFWFIFKNLRTFFFFGLRMSAIPHAAYKTRGPALAIPGTKTVHSRDISTAIPNFRPQKSINKKNQLVGEKKELLQVQNRAQRGEGGGVVMQTKVGGHFDTPTQLQQRRQRVAGFGSTVMVPTQVLDPTGSETMQGDREFDPSAPSMQDMSMIRSKSRSEIQRIKSRLKELERLPANDNIRSEKTQLTEQLKAFSRHEGSGGGYTPKKQDLFEASSNKVPSFSSKTKTNDDDDDSNIPPNDPEEEKKVEPLGGEEVGGEGEKEDKGKEKEESDGEVEETPWGKVYDEPSIFGGNYDSDDEVEETQWGKVYDEPSIRGGNYDSDDEVEETPWGKTHDEPSIFGGNYDSDDEVEETQWGKVYDEPSIRGGNYGSDEEMKIIPTAEEGGNKYKFKSTPVFPTLTTRGPYGPDEDEQDFGQLEPDEHPGEMGPTAEERDKKMEERKKARKLASEQKKVADLEKIRIQRASWKVKSAEKMEKKTKMRHLNNWQSVGDKKPDSSPTSSPTPTPTPTPTPKPSLSSIFKEDYIEKIDEFPHKPKRGKRKRDDESGEHKGESVKKMEKKMVEMSHQSEKERTKEYNDKMEHVETVMDQVSERLKMTVQQTKDAVMKYIGKVRMAEEPGARKRGRTEGEGGEKGPSFKLAKQTAKDRNSISSSSTPSSPKQKEKIEMEPIKESYIKNVLRVIDEHPSRNTSDKKRKRGDEDENQNKRIRVEDKEKAVMEILTELAAVTDLTPTQTADVLESVVVKKEEKKEEITKEKKLRYVADERLAIANGRKLRWAAPRKNSSAVDKMVADDRAKRKTSQKIHHGSDRTPTKAEQKAKLMLKDVNKRIAESKRKKGKTSFKSPSIAEQKARLMLEDVERKIAKSKK
jgi:hypothetical protein